MKKQPQSGLADLLGNYFRKRLASQSKASPATITSYKDALRLFILFLSEKQNRTPSRLCLETIGQAEVLEFLDYLEKERHNCVRTRNARLAAIRSFFEYAATQDPSLLGISQKIRTIPRKRTIRPTIGYLRREELGAMLELPNRSTAQGFREYALLLFLGRTGARISEALGVNSSDVRLVRPWQVLLRGKGNKERIVPLDEATHEALKTLSQQYPSSQESPIFRNAQGQRLTRFGATYLIKKHTAALARTHPDVGKLRITPHIFRHTVAMHLLQAGVDITTIRAWLGHVSLETTHQYIDADIEMKRAALAKCDHVEASEVKYQPKDEVLKLLESL